MLAIRNGLGRVVEVLQHEVVADLEPGIRWQRKALVLFAEAFLIRPQRLFGLLALGDVGDHRDGPHALSQGSEQRACGDDGPAQRSVVAAELNISRRGAPSKGTWHAVVGRHHHDHRREGLAQCRGPDKAEGPLGS